MSLFISINPEQFSPLFVVFHGTDVLKSFVECPPMWIHLIASAGWINMTLVGALSRGGCCFLLRASYQEERDANLSVIGVIHFLITRLRKCLPYVPTGKVPWSFVISDWVVLWEWIFCFSTSLPWDFRIYWWSSPKSMIALLAIKWWVSFSIISFIFVCLFVSGVQYEDSTILYNIQCSPR